jgi:DNA-binding MarR family transcriptional regulator
MDLERIADEHRLCAITGHGHAREIASRLTIAPCNNSERRSLLKCLFRDFSLPFELNRRSEMPISGNDSLQKLYERPGFMIRRMNQISVSVFIEETGKLRVTNRQYGIMFVLSHRAGIDQISVANLLGLDRSTTGMVIDKLVKDGFVSRSTAVDDHRRHSLQLTASGKRLLAQLAQPAKISEQRLFSVFTPRERKAFQQLMRKFIQAFNDTTRIPVNPHPFPQKRIRRRGVRRAALER